MIISSLVSCLRAGVSPVCDSDPPGPDEFGVLTLAAVTMGDIARQHAKRIDSTRVKAGWPTIRKGTVLVARGSGSRNLVGACTLVKNDEPRLIPPDTAWVLEPASENAARFLIEFLRSPQGRRAIHAIARGSNGIWKISQEAFLSIKIPQISEIAKENLNRVAAAFDAVTAGLAQLLSAKQVLRQGLRRDILGGHLRSREFASSNRRKAGQFGTVPLDWSIVAIGDVAYELKDRGATDDAIVYSCTKHDGLVPSLEYFGKQIFSRNLDSYRRLTPGDFAYATNHIEEGAIGLLHKGRLTGLVSPMYTTFRPRERVDPEFLYALLKTESYRRIFAARMSASVDRRGSLRWKEFSKIQIALPSIEEQRRIVSVLNLLDRELELLEAQKKHFEIYKRGTLSRLILGEGVVPA